MVTTAFLIFTVSTLAVHINGVPTKEFNHDPCEGKTLCFEKPADYPPEEEMNHIVAKSDLRHFYRVKRDLQNVFIDSKETNECIESIENATIYKATDVEGVVRVVVQSRSLAQIVTKITCKTKKSCFKMVKGFECEQVVSRVSLMIRKEGDVEARPFDIVTGCRCGLREKTKEPSAHYYH